MKIGILGTGVVGQTIAGKLASLGHEVTVGTRDPAATLKKTEKDGMGNAPFSEWHKSNSKVKLDTFANAAAGAEMVLVATNGMATLDAVKAAGKELDGKVLMDISNPLDFSKGMPPSLFVTNTDSLGEQVQKAAPNAKVVKTLNTVNAWLMVDPGKLQGGDHTMFVCGNDAAAKAKAVSFLKESFGWKDIMDLGDLTNARATEGLVALCARIYVSTNQPMFAFKVVR